jgi:hypothetical protein
MKKQNIYSFRDKYMIKDSLNVVMFQQILIKTN